VRAAAIRALEALRDGDLALVEAILEELADPERERLLRCECGLPFRWPGELDDHRRAAHGEAIA
jgi:hypothetical protein